jgi:hypothetical protein
MLEPDATKLQPLINDGFGHDDDGPLGSQPSAEKTQFTATGIELGARFTRTAMYPKMDNDNNPVYSTTDQLCYEAREVGTAGGGDGRFVPCWEVMIENHLNGKADPLLFWRYFFPSSMHETDASNCHKMACLKGFEKGQPTGPNLASYVPFTAYEVEKWAIFHRLQGMNHSPQIPLELVDPKTDPLNGSPFLRSVFGPGARQRH